MNNKTELLYTFTSTPFFKDFRNKVIVSLSNDKVFFSLTSNNGEEISKMGMNDAGEIDCNDFAEEALAIFENIRNAYIKYIESQLGINTKKIIGIFHNENI